MRPEAPPQLRQELVTAVNSHAALVEALEAARNLIAQYDYQSPTELYEGVISRAVRAVKYIKKKLKEA
ncbi:MAG: hypothetical protein Q8R28_03240 [Dehalococcoidia bacterium]|nr:hypothetical protein [Dehalococcoidia bacterium]